MEGIGDGDDNGSTSSGSPPVSELRHDYVLVLSCECVHGACECGHSHIRAMRTPFSAWSVPSSPQSSVASHSAEEDGDVEGTGANNGMGGANKR